MKYAKLKALVIGPYPPPYSGPEMAIKMLLESPLQDEMDLSFLSTNVRKHNTNKGKPGLSMVIAFFVFMGRLTARLIRFRPRIVYYFVTATRLGWLGRDVWCILLSRLFGAKVITHMRAGHFRHRLEQANAFEVGLIKFACRRVEWSLVQAPSLKNQFEGLAKSENIGVVPNMIDVSKYEAVPTHKYIQGNILFLAHLSIAKGYGELLNIIPEIAQSHPDVKFNFAGAKLESERNVLHNQVTGELISTEDPEEIYDKIIKGQYEKNYTYLGILNEAEKIKALKTCDFLVLPSFSEGFSMAVLEAMAMGKPVICTAVGALRDFVIQGENGEVLEPGDTKALAAAVNSLLSDRSYRNTIAEKNAEYVRENFTQAVISQRLGQFFKSAIDQSPAPKIYD